MWPRLSPFFSGLVFLKHPNDDRRLPAQKLVAIALVKSFGVDGLFRRLYRLPEEPSMTTTTTTAEDGSLGYPEGSLPGLPQGAKDRLLTFVCEDFEEITSCEPPTTGSFGVRCLYDGRSYLATFITSEADKVRSGGQKSLEVVRLVLMIGSYLFGAALQQRLGGAQGDAGGSEEAGRRLGPGLGLGRGHPDRKYFPADPALSGDLRHVHGEGSSYGTQVSE